MELAIIKMSGKCTARVPSCPQQVLAPFKLEAVFQHSIFGQEIPPKAVARGVSKTHVNFMQPPLGVTKCLSFIW